MKTYSLEYVIAGWEDEEDNVIASDTFLKPNYLVQVHESLRHLMS